MAIPTHDRWLWLGVGIFFFVTVRGIRCAITELVNLTELDPQLSRFRRPDEKAPENSISIDTLRTLASHPNHNIAQAAASLIVTRFASLPDAASLITKDLHSKNENTRRKAQQTVRYLQDWDAEIGNIIDDPYSLHSANALSQAERDGLYGAAQRDEQETFGQLRTATDIRAASPQFGTEGRRTLSYADDAIGVDQGVVSRLEELAEIGLTSSSLQETYRPGTAPFAGWDSIPSQRPVVGEVEAERRRRRREAMVLHEGDGDVEEEDIIRPRGI